MWVWHSLQVQSTNSYLLVKCSELIYKLFIQYTVTVPVETVQSWLKIADSLRMAVEFSIFVITSCCCTEIHQLIRCYGDSSCCACVLCAGSRGCQDVRFLDPTPLDKFNIQSLVQECWFWLNRGAWCIQVVSFVVPCRYYGIHVAVSLKYSEFRLHRTVQYNVWLQSSSVLSVVSAHVIVPTCFAMRHRQILSINPHCVELYHVVTNIRVSIILMQIPYILWI